MAADLRKSLEQLEKDVWPDPGPSSYLVARCHALRKVPIQSLDAEGLRILIGQRIGQPHLVPLAMKLLSENSLTDGGYYPGDLLIQVVKTAAGDVDQSILADLCQAAHAHPDQRFSKADLTLLEGVLANQP